MGGLAALGVCDACPALEWTGKQLSTAQKRQRIRIEVLKDRGRSARDIAKQLTVDKNTVTSVKLELGMGGEFHHTPKKLRHEHDFYPTPVEALVALLDREDFAGRTWEPACGDGRMVKLMLARKCKVFGSDIQTGTNFLKTDKAVDNVVTNPPFKLATEFVVHAKKVARRKIAMLLPLTYLSGQERQQRIYRDWKYPLRRVWVFSDRVRFSADNTSFLPHAWFVFEPTEDPSGRKADPKPVIGWIV